VPQSLLEMTKDLVIAQIQTKALPPDAMHKALQQTYASLMTLQAQEETDGTGAVQTTAEPVDWRKSITRHAVTCLECGASFKQLSRHLAEHHLDPSSYRSKYGIPRSQPLAARSVTAMRRKIMQEVKPWEKAPGYVRAQAEKANVARKTGRKRVVGGRGRRRREAMNP
jgi:predicted transcriptional regulator